MKKKKYSKVPGREVNDKTSTKMKTSKLIGYILAAVQAAASVIMVVMVLMLDMLPMKYMLPIILVLVFLWAVVFVSQLKAKKKAIAGKVFSVFMSLVLIIGSFYVFKANGAVKKISGGEYKIDSIVVAVRKDDKAESIEEAADYVFGVQYKLKGDNIRDAVTTINDELESEIAVQEYNSLNEQAQSRFVGNVNSNIYN